jgi:hypothetical protein
MRGSTRTLGKYVENSSQCNDWLQDGQARNRSSSPGRVNNFQFFISSRPALEPTQPSVQWVAGALPPGIKRPVREAGHSPLISAKVKKTWI